ncbi:transglutaminase [Microvirga sp. KLBC 81]|uniref:transglutaminase-like domain-containing protein n=1 Tax=Microvirga sp. KLBC 81 TaxID=1862707 RepID=UPI000D510586|nr:transglutaminase family protein [Microvirga sp. KLBC 81]PVE24059.1 transglutaminase [Microvirga sp. KLBC 81]
MNVSEQRLYLSPAEYVDSDYPAIRKRTEELTAGLASAAERAKVLYDAVRDGIRYDPYVDYTNRESFRASSVLAAGRGYCVSKAALYAALCRAGGIPARIGLSDVRNHLATPRLLAAVGTDVFSCHGYVEVHLGNRWLKATPTFNASLCAKLGVEPLDFDGSGDALFQPFDGEGRAFMDYVVNHGTFFDVPAKFLMGEMARLYPALCRPGGYRGQSMEEEAGASAAPAS